MINTKLKDNKRLANKASINPDLLRQRRAIAFQAFDIYKTNAMYGVVPDDPAEHIRIMKWYNACLDMEHPDLVRQALDGIPEVIQRYMRR